ncbi:aspartyl protease family protein [Nanoarchaeota archaeon]
MSLIYKFKKEKLLDGKYVTRPIILVTLNGKDISIEIPALIDTGCDISVIPEGIAKLLGLDMTGEKNKLYAYRESSEVIESRADISFIGKEMRQSITLKEVPLLIATEMDRYHEELDITLGIAGIFDSFDIAFRKNKNKIILKKVNNYLKS